MAHNVNGKQFFAVLVKECFKSCDLTACTAEQNIFIVCKQGFYLLINTSGVALHILRALQFVKLAFIAYGNVPCNKIFVICTAENTSFASGIKSPPDVLLKAEVRSLYFAAYTFGSSQRFASVIMGQCFTHRPQSTHLLSSTTG